MDDSTFQDFHWLLDILQSADIGILVLDKNFTIEIYNRFMQVHSGLNAEQAIGCSVFELFPYLEDDWFKRRVNSVFELGVPVYTTSEQRDNVFDFALKLPIHYDINRMFQNITFVPLRSSQDTVEKVGIVVYDVTEAALNSRKLEQARAEILLLSRTDILTTLWNRSYWQECLHREYKRYQRSDEVLSLIILDIDHIQQINDSYGHSRGDEVIRQVSRLLLEYSREVDICGRYDGEQFTAILPGTDAAGAETFCERLRQAVAALSITGSDISLTISLGAAVLDDGCSSAENWLSCADKALAKAKRGGRNCTHLYSPR